MCHIIPPKLRGHLAAGLGAAPSAAGLFTSGSVRRGRSISSRVWSGPVHPCSVPRPQATVQLIEWPTRLVSGHFSDRVRCLLSPNRQKLSEFGKIGAIRAAARIRNTNYPALRGSGADLCGRAVCEAAAKEASCWTTTDRRCSRWEPFFIWGIVAVY